MNEITSNLGLGYGIGYRPEYTGFMLIGYSLLVELYPLEETDNIFKHIWKVVLDIDGTL